MEKKVLTNGLTVVLDPKPIGEAGVYLIINAGTGHVIATETAHLLEHLQATASKVYGEKGALEYGDANATTYDERTMYHITGILPKHLPQALENLSAVFQQPDFRLFEREKAAIVNELLPKINPEKNFGRKTLEARVPGYTSRRKGIPERVESVKQLTIEDINKFWKQHYHALNAILYVAGEWTNFEQHVNDSLMQYSLVRTGEKTLAPNWPTESELGQELLMEDHVRADNAASVGIQHLVAKIPEATLKQVLARAMLTRYLGSDGGPLYRKLRDAAGAVYSLEAGWSEYGNKGIVTFSALGYPNKVQLAINNWLETIVYCAAEGMPSEVLETMKLRQRIQNARARNAPDVNAVVNELFYGITQEQHDQQVRRLTIEDIAIAAQEILKSKPVISIAYPKIEINRQSDKANEENKEADKK